MGSTGKEAGKDGVKSADRAMAVMEFFREYRRPATAREISAALNMPRSSTNVLLRSQIQAGYLHYEEDALTYFPTLKLFQLGNWLIEGFLTDPVIDTVMKRLVERTQETVCIWVMIGDIVRILRVLPSPQAISLRLREGDSAPLTSSIVGLSFLAEMSDEDISRRLARSNHGKRPKDKLSLDSLLVDIRAIRGRGVGVGYGRWIEDAGAVVALLDRRIFREPIALAVGGPKYRVKRNERDIEASLKQAVASLRR